MLVNVSVVFCCEIRGHVCFSPIIWFMNERVRSIKELF